MSVEVCEKRSLLTSVVTSVGGVATPGGAPAIAEITDSTPAITWSAVDDAVSYDVWISSVETFQQVDLQTGLTGFSYTPADELPLGRGRIWIRANFADGSHTGWGRSQDFLLTGTPSLTGPAGDGRNNIVSDTTPVFTWDSTPGADRFEIFLTDRTLMQGKVYRFDNNADGDLNEWELPAEDALRMGRYTAYIRTVDPSGRVSAYSDPLNFDIGPAVTITRPTAPTFQTQPLLQWRPVDRATSYEVFVGRYPFGTPIPEGTAVTPIYRETVTGTSYQIPDTLAAGGYVFWVRAVSAPEGKPVVYGSWGKPAQFSTLIAPQFTETSDIKTALRPMLGWTPIDSAARYEVWINKANTRSPFLRTNASTNSFTFPEALEAGTYYAWVRAVSTNGTFSRWSEAYTFEASGGVPLITSPGNGEDVIGFPDYRWVGDPDAESYEIFVAHIGVDFTFINVAGIEGTEYVQLASDGTELQYDPGAYRVWVRSIYADTSTSAWSAPVSFTISGTLTSKDKTDSLIDPQLMLTSLETTPQNQQEVVAADSSQSESEPVIVAAASETHAAAVADSPSHFAQPTADEAAEPGLTADTVDNEDEALLVRLAEQHAVLGWFDLT